jgi:hypothetical protein
MQHACNARSLSAQPGSGADAGISCWWPWLILMAAAASRQPAAAPRASSQQGSQPGDGQVTVR